jgi:hypothetical protein
MLKEVPPQTPFENLLWNGVWGQWPQPPEALFYPLPPESV